MDIKITGRSDGVTGAMKRKARGKVAKLVRYNDRITWLDVVLDAGRQRKRVEIHVGLKRGSVQTVRSEGEDMYAAIDLAIDKISRQLRRHKDKLRDHRPRRSDASPGGEEAAESEPTFEDAIEDM